MSGGCNRSLNLHMRSIPKSPPVMTWRLPPDLAADKGSTDDSEGSSLTSTKFKTRAQYSVESVSTNSKAGIALNRREHSEKVAEQTSSSHTTFYLDVQEGEQRHVLQSKATKPSDCREGNDHLGSQDL